MMQKTLRLINCNIYPASDDVRATVEFGYVTDIVDNGSVLASSAPHRGGAPLDDLDRVVSVSASGDTKTVGEILAEAGLRVA